MGLLINTRAQQQQKLNKMFNNTWIEYHQQNYRKTHGAHDDPTLTTLFQILFHSSFPSLSFIHSFILLVLFSAFSYFPFLYLFAAFIYSSLHRAAVSLPSFPPKCYPSSSSPLYGISSKARTLTNCYLSDTQMLN